jgi:hypothetical protein
MFYDDLIDTPNVELSDDSNRNIFRLKSKYLDKKSIKYAEQLVKKWHVGLYTANRTVKVTMQKVVKQALHPISRRYRTKQTKMRYNSLNSRFYSDTMIADCKSLNQNKYAQVFVNSECYSKIYPMISKGHAGYALGTFLRDVGIPTHLHVDNAREMTGPMTKWMQLVRDADICQTTTEPHSPCQNRCETEIKEIKKYVACTMKRTAAPPCI